MAHSLINLLCLISLCASVPALGQQKRPEAKKRLVAIPPDIALAVIASQPDCPLLIEKVDLYKDTDGDLQEIYQVRNRRDKPIRGFTIANWNSVNTGWSLGWDYVSLYNQPLQPGELSVPLGRPPNSEFTPMTEELKEKLNLKGPMRAVEFFLITEVEFMDGSTYRADSTYEGLQKHLRGSVVIKRVDP